VGFLTFPVKGFSMRWWIITAALLAALPALQRLTALPDPRTEPLPGALTNA
jgi:hypothetical protein